MANIEKWAKSRPAGMDAKEFQLPPELKDGYVSPEEKEKERKAKLDREAARGNPGTNAQ